MEFSIRHQLRPGDLGAIVLLHGRSYAREYGFDSTFEAYVAGPLAEFALRQGPRERIWIAESGENLAGCIAIVEAASSSAQLRWFLVDSSVRGHGLGSRLIRGAVDYCASVGYLDTFLWTVDLLADAARLYSAAGFQRTESLPARRWGVDLVEERYELILVGNPKTGVTSP